ncbi:hypothetical protein DL98DRAFT_526796 [Cadophora sp. DSE1049]|nr:hypothetical protein DL98DRAFT_526796 [Cadophora sp. DSE1049]
MDSYTPNLITLSRIKDKQLDPPVFERQNLREPKGSLSASSGALPKPANTFKSTHSHPSPNPQIESSASQRLVDLYGHVNILDLYSHVNIIFYFTEDCQEFRKYLTSKVDYTSPLRMNLRFENRHKLFEKSPLSRPPKVAAQADFTKSFEVFPNEDGAFIQSWKSGQGMKEIIDTMEYYMASIYTSPSDLELPGGKHTPTSHKRVSFYVHWRFRQFLRNQFQDVQTDPGSIIVVVGTARHVQATTIDEYCKRMWPKTSHTFLSAVGSLQDDLEITVKERQQTDLADILMVEASTEEIVEIAQQLVFLGSAFATSTAGKIEHSKGSIFLSADNKLHVRFRVDDSPVSESYCWQNLFVNPVLVPDFPVEPRESFVELFGLYIPLEMMSALGGAVHQVEFAGGIVIKGVSAMFVPVKRVGDCVQWHFIYNEDGSRLPYWEADKRCPERALLGRVNRKTLASTRAVLGWWGKVTTRLGSASINYQSICWTDLKEPSRSVRFYGGSIGFQMFGAGELNFSVGPKDSRLHISRPGPYQRIIKHASNTPVVLFDTDKSDRRGWLVPASSVVAHIVQTKHARRNFIVDGTVAEIKPTSIDLDVCDAAEKMLYENAATILIRDPWEHSIFAFKDLVLAIWSLLEILMDQGCKRDATTEPGLHTTTRRKIRGWEFMDLVTERNSIRMKETILKNSSGNWTDLAHDINAVVLLASGLEDLIIPQQHMEPRLCHNWNKVPEEKDYLTAGVPILETLFEQAGSRKYLTSTRLQWHRSPILFEDCEDMRQDSGLECNCDRVQQILPDSKMTPGKINPPGPLPSQGAVVFGQSSHAVKSVYKELMEPLKPAFAPERKFNLLVNLGLFRQRTLGPPFNLSTDGSGSQKPSLKGKEIEQSTTTMVLAETEVD